MPRMEKPHAHAPTPIQPSTEESLALRKRAQARLAKSPASPSVEQLAQMPLAMQKVLHELQVHQIELEMQNDELCRAQTALDVERRIILTFTTWRQWAIARWMRRLDQQANLTTARLMG